MIDTVRILLVDDDKIDFRIMDEILSRMDCSYKTTMDWEEDFDNALKAIKEERHDIYFIDYNLSMKGTGLDLIKDAVADGHKGHFVLMSGQEPQDLHPQMKVSRCYLSKDKISPFVIDKVICSALRIKGRLKKPAEEFQDSGDMQDSEMEIEFLDRPKRVLLIEDDPIDVKMFMEVSKREKLNIETVTKKSLQEAIEILSEREFDVIFLDLNLKDGIGPSSVASIKKEANDTPVVVLTGMGTDVTNEECRKLGANGFMFKSDISEEKIRSVL